MKPKSRIRCKLRLIQATVKFNIQAPGKHKHLRQPSSSEESPQSSAKSQTRLRSMHFLFAQWYSA